MNVSGNSGVYLFLNERRADRAYIGKAVRFDQRYVQHVTALRAGTHPILPLQEDWDLQAGEGFLWVEALVTASPKHDLSQGVLLNWVYRKSVVLDLGRSLTPDPLERALYSMCMHTWGFYNVAPLVQNFESPQIAQAARTCAKTWLDAFDLEVTVSRLL